MSDKSAIEWTDATWNPIKGTTFDRWMCQKISPGCDNCYASTFNQRWGGMEYPREGSLNRSAWQLDEPTLFLPRRWKKPRRVFVCSMTDLFGEWVTQEWLDRIFHTMAMATQHTFQVLTKRPTRMRDYLTLRGVRERIWWNGLSESSPRLSLDLSPNQFGRWPLPNIWIGTSVELDRYAWRANAVRDSPAAVRFISAEPLLGPLHSLDLTDIDWLITGGESGPKHRPLDVAWVRDLRDRSQANGTAFFHKQHGGHTPKAGGRLLDGRTWDEYPAVPA